MKQVSALNPVKKTLTIPRQCFFCGYFCYFCFMSVMLSFLFIAALWSPAGTGLTLALLCMMFSCVFVTFSCGVPGFYRTQYPASYTHKSLGRTPQFTLSASAGTQTCLLCLSLKSQIPKLFRNDSVFPIFTAYL